MTRPEPSWNPEVRICKLILEQTLHLYRYNINIGCFIKAALSI